MNRRSAVRALAGAAVAQAATRGMAQAPARPASAQPEVIVYSQNLIQIEYPELGEIVKQLGFDGVDLTVFQGGHVDPQIANVDLVRAIESIQGRTLSVPVISTALTSPLDPTVRPVLGLAGMSRIPLFRPGYWNYANAPHIPARIAEVQRDFANLVNIGRQYGIAGAFHNHPEHVGAAVWDTQRILEPLDPAWAGFYFDPCNATADGGISGWEVSLRLALPRTKAVTVQDFVWEKVSGRWQMTKCPLGQGMVDWPKFFQMLSQANFAGPVTVQVDYSPKDMPSALMHDLQFVRKQIQPAWPGSAKT